MNVIRIASWNVWYTCSILTSRDLYGIAKERKYRIREIIEYLQTHSNEYDLIGLQELWVSKDFQALKLALQSTLPYSHYYKQWIFGSGLAIFSRYKITQVRMLEFPINGSPWRILWGDWWTGKGVGTVFIDIPISGTSTEQINQTREISFMNCHLHASYDDASTEPIRLVQLLEWRKEFDRNSRESDAVIAVGDFNILSTESAYLTLIKEQVDDPGDNIRVTHGFPGNSFSSANPKRIDYIFTHNMDCLEIDCTDIKSVCSLSDHGLLRGSFAYNSYKSKTMSAKSYMPMDRRTRELLIKYKQKKEKQHLLILIANTVFTILSFGFGIFSLVSVYMENFPKTLSLLLYIFIPVFIYFNFIFTILWIYSKDELSYLNSLEI